MWNWQHIIGLVSVGGHSHLFGNSAGGPGAGNKYALKLLCFSCTDMNWGYENALRLKATRLNLWSVFI